MDSDERARNRALIQGLVDEVWMRRDLDALERYWSPHARNHAAPAGTPETAQALRDYHAGFFEALGAFDDVRITIERQAAEGDVVASQIVLTATHVGEFAGIAATGRTVTLRSMRFDRILDGRIAEHWSVADMAGTIAQLSSA